MEEAPSERPVTSGLDLLISLYKPIDETFVSLWNKVRTQANPNWIAQLQDQLSEALPAFLECTESQAVDLRITQQWLRTMVWQLCVSQGRVSSVAADSAMTFKYPIEISRDLLAMTQQFSQHAMEVHGMSLIEKLFDIACCLTDVVACIPFSPNAFALGPRDYVSRFLTLFSALRGGQTRYLQLLIAKVSDVLPNLPLPRSLDIPRNISTSTISLGPSTLASAHPAMGEDLSAVQAVASPSYPSTELIRQLAAQTGAQLPFNVSHHSLLQLPSSRVEQMSLYDTSAPQSTHSSGSAPPSQSGTPGPYEASSVHPHAQVPSHTPHQIPSTHPPPGHMHGHPLGLDPSAYDPRFSIHGFPVDPSMAYKQDDAAIPGQLQNPGSMYPQPPHGPGRGSLGPRGGHGGGYAG